MSFSLLLFVPIALLLYYFIKRQGFEYLSKVWLVGGGIIFYASQNILYLLFFSIPDFSLYGSSHPLGEISAWLRNPENKKMLEKFPHLSTVSIMMFSDE